MKRIAETLEVSRQHQHECLRKEAVPRRGYYTRAHDDWYVNRIKGILKNRQSYGYKRVTAILNRELEEEGKSRVNHKRVYRLMKKNKLTLQRGHERPVQEHDGRIITKASNLRWCSDGFEIKCLNGEKVRVAFSLDCCDREVMSYIATTGGMGGNEVRDVMVESAEKRKIEELGTTVEWLSDNGPGYISRDTRKFAQQLNLKPCTTPYYSPESNGMAESFVKTIKRDYVAFGDLSNAMVVLKQLPQWIEDYNEYHPHSGLKMLSPRQFIRKNAKLEKCPVNWG